MGREVSLAQSQLPVEEVKAQVDSIQKLMGCLMRNRGTLWENTRLR